MYANSNTIATEANGLVKTLFDMLAWRRPAHTKTERIWCEKYIKPLGVTQDGYGNFIKIIGDAPRILWSSHTDTVHRMGGKQEIELKEGFIRLAETERQSNCLGADDTTGVWLMREMILANVPGLYVFHRAEETGCNGSKWIEEHTPELLKGIQIAVAFDRKGYDSVITHQASGRTASDTFALELASILGGEFEADPTGMFTDTDTYAELVPECTNLSVGYSGAHSKSERQDVVFALWLRERLLAADFSSLKASRDPKADAFEFNDWSNYRSFESVYKATSPSIEARDVRNSDTLYSYCRDHWDVVAEFLEEQGYTAKDLEEYFYSAMGRPTSF